MRAGVGAHEGKCIGFANDLVIRPHLSGVGATCRNWHRSQQQKHVGRLPGGQRAGPSPPLDEIQDLSGYANAKAKSNTRPGVCQKAHNPGCKPPPLSQTL
jgi:hypothetical protein